MQYHLDTIPVWEAMEQPCSCPLCYLHDKVEKSEIERSLGGSVMEPEERIKINEKGLCGKHHIQLFMQQNRLGHALLTDSHSKELLKKLQKLEKQADSLGGHGLFAKTDDCAALADALSALADGCVICDYVNNHMERYLYTFLYLWKTDDAFREKWSQSGGVCIPHGAQLLQMAGKQLKSDKQKAFVKSLLALLTKALAEDEKDLEWFTLKFDYRNQDKPWGNSRNALERTIGLLRGINVGSQSK